MYTKLGIQSWSPRRYCAMAKGTSFHVGHCSEFGIIDVIKFTLFGFLQIGLAFESILKIAR